MRARMCIILLIIMVLTAGCQQDDIIENPSITSREWNLILESANGTTVTLYYTKADERLERWLTRTVAPGVLSENGIKLELVRKPMTEIMEKLSDQKMMEIDTGSIDLLYFDDTSFKKLMSNELLYGPFLEKLPNYHANVNKEDFEFIYEEGMPTQGYYMPVGRDQLVFIYDEDMILDPPASMEIFVETLRTAPGQFSFPLPPEKSGELFMETFIAAYVNHEKLYLAEPSRQVIEPMIEPAIEALKKLKPKLWKEGAIFPEDEEHLDQLFYDGKVSFALSTDTNKASKYAKAEVYPYAARAFVMDEGTAGTNSGVVIAHNAPNKSGAMIVANYMLSAHAQTEKYEPSNWGNIPVIDTNIMPEEEGKMVNRVSIKRSDIKQELLNNHRVPPMPADVKKIVTEIWLETLEPIDE